MTAAPIAVPQPHNARSLYTDLAAQVRESGLLRRRYGYYWRRIAGPPRSPRSGPAFFLLGNTWFQLLLAAALGVVVTQFGFLGHDAAHRQIFRSPAWNEWTSRVIAGSSPG